MVAMDHLLVAPVLLPLATAALMLLLGEGRRGIKAVGGAPSWRRLLIENRPGAASRIVG